MQYGARANLIQFMHLLLQVLLVGLTLGMTRTVVPVIAESSFGVAPDSYLLLVAFVVAFGVVKAAMNFCAGRLSERIGRRRVLALGWAIALPVPAVIWFAPDWNWIVAATILLGVNQGLTWSMTQISKLDITHASERGMAIGLNEFAGYVGVALGGIVTAHLANLIGPRDALLAFGLVVVCAGLLLTLLFVADTRPWVRMHGGTVQASTTPAPHPLPSAREIFLLVSWHDRRLAALSQAGLVEKFVDALVWVFFPIFLYRQNLPLPDIAAVVGIYGLTWGVAQLFTGRLSDYIGRHLPNVAGMWICGAGVALMPLAQGLVGWSTAAAVTGFGMALLYPNLSAAVADIAHPAWRGSALGIYRFWRDLGYGIGGLGLGLAAHWGGQLESAFWFVAVSMLLSGALLAVLGEETLVVAAGPKLELDAPPDREDLSRPLS